jgi:HEAT repeat protein
MMRGSVALLACLAMLAGAARAAPVQSLHAALHDRDPQIRLQAVQSLHRQGGAAAGAMAELQAALADPDNRVRLEAVEAIGDLREVAAPAVPALLGLLHDGDSTVRARVVVALGHIGPAAAAARPALLHLLAGGNRGLRLLAARACWSIDHRAEPLLGPLADALDAGRRTDPAPAVLLIADMGPAAVSLEPALWQLWDDADESLSLFVAYALLRVDDSQGTAQKLLGCLTTLLNGRSASVEPTERLLAAMLLRRVGRWGHGALPSLLGAMQDPSAEVRVAAAAALQTISPEDVRATPILCQHLDVLERWTQQAAALRAVDGGLELDWALLPIDVLGRLGELARVTRPQLEAAAKSPLPAIREAATQALAKVQQGRQ